MFFSVKKPMKIAGKTYIPCICYPVSRFLEMTIDKLEAEGKAFVFRPSEPIKISKTERNPENLQYVYDLGVKDATARYKELCNYLEN